MKFKDTDFGDLTGKVYNGDIGLTVFDGEGKLTSLDGSPREVNGYFACSNHPNLKSLKGAPKVINGQFACYDIGVKDILNEIITNQILANNYYIKNVDGSWNHTSSEIIRDKVKEFGNSVINKRVTRPSMRKLLGLDK